VDVRVFARAGGPSGRAARAAGFAPAPAARLRECGVVAVLVPDDAQPELIRDVIGPHAAPGALLVFAHGFALRHGGETPREDLDVALVGPMGPGALLRERYVSGRGLAGLLAVVRDVTGTARDRALAYAAALRLTRAGVLPTTLDEEVVSDLFAEQALLCGGVPALLRAAWETMVKGGVSEEVAYYTCVQELKQILDLVHAEGPAGMRARTSGTAQYGGLTRGARLVGEETRRELRRILDEVRDGRFAREWLAERRDGAPRLAALVDEEAAHPMEAAGRRVRRALGAGVDSPEDET
jgi:ketol-acid reductoisomerase